jgi:hypothetical protein
LNNGVGGVEISSLLQQLSPVNMNFATIRQFTEANWTRPHHLAKAGVKVSQVFSEVRAKSCNKGGWKSGASEFLMIAPVVLHFLDTVASRVTGELRAHIESFRKLCRVIDLIQAAKQGRVPDYGVIDVAIREGFVDYVDLYGNDDVIPKHHLQTHLTRQFIRDGMILDTLPCERQHQIPKSFGSVVRNTSSYERSVLCRSLLNQLTAIKEFDERDGLRGQSVWVDAVEGHVSKELLCNGQHIHVNDVLLLDGTPMMVKACGIRDRHMFLLCLRGTLLTRISASSARWRLDDRLEVVWPSVARLRPAHCWARSANGSLVVLEPAA